MGTLPILMGIDFAEAPVARGRRHDPREREQSADGVDVDRPVDHHARDFRWRRIAGARPRPRGASPSMTITSGFRDVDRPTGLAQSRRSCDGDARAGHLRARGCGIMSGRSRPVHRIGDVGRRDLFEDLEISPGPPRLK
jgi:hypothetical protein